MRQNDPNHPKIGLAFAGGGGKGAYQIGVWKAMREYRLDTMVAAVAGTSVGGLNAALFVQGDYEKAEYIWEHIQPEQILSKSDSYLLPQVVARAYHRMAGYPNGYLLPQAVAGAYYRLAGYLLPQAVAGAYHRLADYLLPQAVVDAYHRMAGYEGAFFSRGGVEQMIDQYLDLELFTQARLECYLTGCMVKTDLLYDLKKKLFSKDIKDSLSLSAYLLPKVRYFKMREESVETRRQILLATSAIPVIFSDVKIRGDYYLDGGLLDNVPVMPLFAQSGCDIVVAVLLGTGTGYRKNVPSGKRCLEIVPKQEQGGFFSGTLDFHAKHAKRRIQQGYEDTVPVCAQIRADIDREQRHRQSSRLRKRN